MGHIEIRQVGRWRYELAYCPDGEDLWMRLEGPRVWGLRHARHRAERDLRRLEGKPAEVVAVVH